MLDRPDVKYCYLFFRQKRVRDILKASNVNWMDSLYGSHVTPIIRWKSLYSTGGTPAVDHVAHKKKPADKI